MIWEIFHPSRLFHTPFCCDLGNFLSPRLFQTPVYSELEGRNQRQFTLKRKINRKSLGAEHPKWATIFTREALLSLSSPFEFTPASGYVNNSFTQWVAQKQMSLESWLLNELNLNVLHRNLTSRALPNYHSLYLCTDALRNIFYKRPF